MKLFGSREAKEQGNQMEPKLQPEPAEFRPCLYPPAQSGSVYRLSYTPTAIERHLLAKLKIKATEPLADGADPYYTCAGTAIMVPSFKEFEWDDRNNEFRLTLKDSYGIPANGVQEYSQRMMQGAILNLQRNARLVEAVAMLLQDWPEARK